MRQEGGEDPFWLLKKTQTGIGKEDSDPQGVAALAVGKRALEQRDMLAS